MSEPEPHDDQDEPSRVRQIFGFSLSFIASIVLTVLALPLLLNAVCMPMTDGHPTGYFHLPWLRPDVVFVLYIIVAFGGAVAIYRRTSNRGVRWGCAAAVVALAGYVLFLALR